MQHHVMTTHGAVGAHLNAFLTLAFVKREWSALRLMVFGLEYSPPLLLQYGLGDRLGAAT